MVVRTKKCFKINTAFKIYSVYKEIAQLMADKFYISMSVYINKVFFEKFKYDEKSEA